MNSPKKPRAYPLAGRTDPSHTTVIRFPDTEITINITNDINHFQSPLSKVANNSIDNP